MSQSKNAEEIKCEINSRFKQDVPDMLIYEIPPERLNALNV